MSACVGEKQGRVFGFVGNSGTIRTTLRFVQDHCAKRGAAARHGREKFGREKGRRDILELKSRLRCSSRGKVRLAEELDCDHKLCLSLSCAVLYCVRYATCSGAVERRAESGRFQVVLYSSVVWRSIGGYDGSVIVIGVDLVARDDVSSSARISILLPLCIHLTNWLCTVSSSSSVAKSKEQRRRSWRYTA